ncbi:MAG: aquaporin [Saprospiraceae bacterium]|nr:aquaporin [Saprospiraceae bacterium]
MKKYLGEFIGSFFLTLSLVLTLSNPATVAWAPLAAGLLLMALIPAGKTYSEAHFNPAITLAALMRGKIDRTDALYYVVAQLAAGVAAAAIGAYLHQCGNGAEVIPRLQEQALCTIIVEFLGVFALAFVALNVSTDGSAKTGMALGAAQAALMFALGGLSGGAFNPAVALGTSVAGLIHFGDLLLYLTGNVFGAAAAATVVQLLEKTPD